MISRSSDLTGVPVPARSPALPPVTRPTERPATGEYLIPFNRATAVANELELMAQSLARGHIAGDGAFTRQCSELLQRVLGVPRALLATSCTHALEMAALLLDLREGDEVIVPSFTFVSTVNAFALRGARPVFADVRPDTLNMDEAQLEALITPRTRAIVPVHYAGVGCEMDEIMRVARAHGLAVVEDNAHGLFGRYRGRELGTFGAFATQSFHETKNFTCGEGGALLINDERHIERAEILREKGTNRSRFFRGLVDKYTWVDVGSSYLPSDMLAAFLFAQLSARAEIQARRAWIWHYYDEHLAAWTRQNGAQRPFVPAHTQQAYHMYYLLMPSLEARQGLMAHLRARGILSVFHYLPLHLSDRGRAYGGQPGQCPVTEDVSDRLLRLPFFYSLSEAELEEVVGAIREFRCD
jgi:dTDP-4-amino-4,6-dideoxygalactose transaminase